MLQIEAKQLLDFCFGLGPSEKVAILSAVERMPEGLALLEAVQEIGAQGVMATSSVRLGDGELLGPISAAMRWADVLIFAVGSYETQVMGHHPLRRDATARGARIGFLTGKLSDADPVRLKEIWARAMGLAHRLERAEEARLVAPSGTDIRLSLKGRKGMAVIGDLRAPGAWGALPDYAEATISPQEGLAEGIVVADGMMTGYGRLADPLTLRIEGGKVVSLEGDGADWLTSMLRSDEGASMVAEMGLGANFFASELVGDFEDKKVYGTAHIGIGDNRSFGGSNGSSVHIDVLIRDVSLYLDEVQVIP